MRYKAYYTYYSTQHGRKMTEDYRTKREAVKWAKIHAKNALGYKVRVFGVCGDGGVELVVDIYGSKAVMA